MHFIVHNAIHIYVLCYHLIYKGNWKALYLLIWEALHFYNSYPSFPLKFLRPTRLHPCVSSSTPTTPGMQKQGQRHFVPCAVPPGLTAGMPCDNFPILS